MRVPLPGLLFILLVASPLFGQQNSKHAIPNSPRSFDKQYKSVFRAYEKGDEKELLERFHTFAIPEHWFTDEFGPEDGPKLSRQYLYRFRDFETDTVQEFNRVTYDGDGGCNRGQIQTRAAKATKLTQAPPALTSLRSLPRVQRFRIEHFSPPEVNGCFSDITGGSDNSCNSYPTGTMYQNSWVSSFIYLDGEFRFVAWGTCSSCDSCAGNQPISESQLNKPPEPVHFNLMQKSQSRDLLAWVAKLQGKNH